MSDRKFILIKYRIAWYIGTLISFFLYFTGIITLYTYLRRKYLKKYIAVVLMYHRISDDNDDPDITVSTASFERQVRYLKENYKVASLDEILNIYISNSPLTKDTVAITFDDGHRDNYTNAYPTLKKYDAPAAIFVAINFIGQHFGLTEEQILTMKNNNIIFGAHTMTHRVLADLDKYKASFEIGQSKSALEQIVKERVKYFAYPYGVMGRDFTDESVQIVKKTGFTAAFVTNNGFINSSSNIFLLKRIGIRDVPLFVFKGRLSGIFENELLYVLRGFLKI